MSFVSVPAVVVPELIGVRVWWGLMLAVPVMLIRRWRRTRHRVERHDDAADTPERDAAARGASVDRHSVSTEPSGTGADSDLGDRVSGVGFPAGSIVFVSAWHANREDAEPDSFDITVGRGGVWVLTFCAGS
jgi:hypothetical protein